MRVTAKQWITHNPEKKTPNLSFTLIEYIFSG